MMCIGLQTQDRGTVVHCQASIQDCKKVNLQAVDGRAAGLSPGLDLLGRTLGWHIIAYLYDLNLNLAAM